MDIEKLLLLRNTLNTDIGNILKEYLSDYITKNACLNRDASEIKGMCELLEQIKKVPERVEGARK